MTPGHASFCLNIWMRGGLPGRGARLRVDARSRGGSFHRTALVSGRLSV